MWNNFNHEEHEEHEDFLNIIFVLFVFFVVYIPAIFLLPLRVFSKKNIGRQRIETNSIYCLLPQVQEALQQQDVELALYAWLCPMRRVWSGRFETCSSQDC